VKGRDSGKEKRGENDSKRGGEAEQGREV